MSDLMLLGVLQMPFDMVASCYSSTFQYVQRGHEAAARIKADTALIEQQAARIAELEAQLATVAPAVDAQAIRREALEEAAKVCDALSTDYNRHRKTSDNPTYMEGKSDGAEACASALYRAIRALSQKETGE